MGMGIATFKIVLLLHVVIQTLIYYILTEILSKVLIQYRGIYIIIYVKGNLAGYMIHQVEDRAKSHALAWDLPSILLSGNFIVYCTCIPVIPEFIPDSIPNSIPDSRV